MDIADLRARVVQLEHISTDKQQRLTILEQWKQKLEVMEAQRSTEWNATIRSFNERFTTLEKHFSDMFSGLDGRLSEISGWMKKVAWLIVSGFFLCLLALVWKGAGGG